MYKPLFSIFISIFILFISGLLLGLSAPGIGLWPIAWFGLVPLLIMARRERTILKVLFYAFIFGLAYNAVYWQWLLGLAPLDWLGFNAWQSNLMAAFALFVCAGHQALLIALFIGLYHLLRKIPSFLHLLLVPTLWILIINKWGNAHDLTGVPWSMLEYTQYKQIYLIQIADTIGGIGISFLMVMINTLLSLIAEDALGKKLLSSSIRRFSFPIIVCGSLIMLIFAYGRYAYGHYAYHPAKEEAEEIVSIVQPNINIDMEKTDKKYSVFQLLGMQFSLAANSSSSSNKDNQLCIWTESAIPIYLAGSKTIQNHLIDFAKEKKLSLIVGTVDKDGDSHLYNAAWGVSSTGEVSSAIYHKRYLVPFGEYTPLYVRQWPEWILRLTNTPAGEGYTSGKDAALIKIGDKSIAPLICFEIISPELAAESVRAGGQLLVNINDLAWFHQSIIGEQMIAAATLRAVENRRYLIFAANTGPSAVISPAGTMQSYIGQNICTVLHSKINYSRQLSLFTRYFVF